MITSSSLRKYILYAVGEITLVVIGILIALQVNNWNEARKSRIIEKTVVEELYKELTQNLTYTNTELDLAKKRQKSVTEVLSLTGKRSLHVIEEEFSLHLIKSLAFEVYSPIINKTNEVINKSQLSFFYSDSLGDKLSDYLSHINELEEYYLYNVDTWKTIVRPYLNKNYSLQSIVKLSRLSNFSPSSNFEVFPDRMLNDREFENIFINIYTDINAYSFTLEENIVMMESLINQIKRDYPHVDNNEK